MSTQLLEGSIADIRKGLNSLRLAPDARLQVLLKSSHAEPATLIDPFVPTEFWNGAPLLPIRESSEPVTLELVNKILDEAYQIELGMYPHGAVIQDGVPLFPVAGRTQQVTSEQIYAMMDETD